MFVCIETSSIEVFNPKYQVLQNIHFKSEENTITLKSLIRIYKL
jgi:hypothetical protein